MTKDKYVGEMSVEETEQTLTDPNERILKQITVEDINAANVLFDQLMGTGVVARKEYKYIKNDEELEKFKAANPNKKFQVNRMKGLGEMSVEETEQTLTDPKERIIKQITVEDAHAADILFDQLMGTGVVARKEYIKAHSEEAMYNAE